MTPLAQTALPTPPKASVSMARQLLLWLLLPQWVVWLAGGVACYQLAASYVNQSIDASLLQASKALARQLKPIGNGLLIDFPKAAQAILEADPSDRLLYTVSSPPGQFILGNQALPLPSGYADLPLEQAHFYNSTGPQTLRITALRLSLGDAADQTVSTGPVPSMLVQVARSSANREELAQRILVDMLLPMSGLVLLLTLLVWAGIRAGLAPLHRLRLQVEGRAPTDLAPLQLASAPRELWSLASALNTLLAAVQNNVNTQKRFIGDAAHQLRTPLAGLKSQTELALQSVSEPALLARLQRVHASATRSAHLVNQLLTLARAEPESLMAQDRHPFDLHDMAQQLTAEWVPRALKAQIDLGMDEAIEACATPIWVHGNALLVREALTNVIDNALHYAGPHTQVTVQVQSVGGMAVLSVSDTGAGIPETDRERVMERFVRGTDTGDGCGLGLAIVREIIERHQGQVGLSSAQPHGLLVTIRLPLHASF